MLRQFSMFVSNPRCYIFYIALFMVSCQPGTKNVEPPQRQVNIQAERFEKDLMEKPGDIAFMQHRYGTFFDLYTYQITGLGTVDTVLLKSRLTDFVNDPDITVIYADTKKEFSDFTGIDKELSAAFSRYSSYFPEKIIPKVITFISGFNFAIVCADSALGIGLDMYLGSDSRFYPSLQMPEYKIRRMRREFITADALRGWAQSDWEADAAHSDLLSQMIYLGKIQYFLDQVIPDSPDTIKFGYTGQQLGWCEASEKAIWSFFVDKQLLFVSDAGQIWKYVNDGPTTNGFPKESPGNIGAWMGYRIVSEYMKKYPSVSLPRLMAENDYQKIFRDSNYKPAK